MIVALDGPAGSGKTSTAKAVARALAFTYLDTGAMYRAITLASLQMGKEITEDRVNELVQGIKLDIRYREADMQVFLDDVDVTGQIRTEAVNNNVSLVSSFGAVREKMVASQREIAERVVAEGGGVVVDGRDIGTVVFPAAELKVFMQASPAVRAERRLKELQEQDEPAKYEDILKNIQERDHFDSTREIAPLKKADDAIVLDTSKLSFDEQIVQVVEWVKERADKSDV